MAENEKPHDEGSREEKKSFEGKEPKRTEVKRPGAAKNQVQAGKGDFSIVAVGASAGGLRAIEALLTHLPDSPGMAFVILQHQAPDRESVMPSLLKSYTSLPVVKIEEGMAAEPDRVYVRPPDQRLTIRDGRFFFASGAGSLPLKLIDNFFFALADDQGENAVSIILSGAGADGSQGLRAVNAAGGLVMAQEENQAEYPSMPRAAVETGLVDFILPAEQMGEKLLGYERQSRKARREIRRTLGEQRLETELDKVPRIVQRVTGHDFSRYKKSTIGRRIQRRMALHQFERVADYLTYLSKESAEVHALFNDLLINVTSFFRDPEAFAALEKELEELLRGRSSDDPVRVWVPGCATGEEAYSLAILLTEIMERQERKVPVKIFATDINQSSLQTGRAGAYPDSIAADLSESRLNRFFTRGGNHLRISGQLRDMVIFSLHNVASDPPFSNLDLVSCRNLLIYMDQRLQKRVLPLLHYSLNQKGLLFLGSSEDVGGLTDLFTALNRKWKIFRSRSCSPERHHQIFRLISHPSFPARPNFLPGTGDGVAGEMAPAGAGVGRRGSMRDLVERAMVEEYTPPAVVVDADNRILFFHGDTGRYLTTPRGEPVFDLLRMARRDLVGDLTELLRAARRQKGQVMRQAARVYLENQVLQIDLAARRISSRHSADDHLLVTFKEQPREESPEVPGAADGRLAALQGELYATRQDLQATIQELESTNEELQSANEELQANNEELQSTNEELETSREELQSTNEELETVNAELQNKNEMLRDAGDDQKNLFDATEICTVIVDAKLRIKRFTPAAVRIFRLIEGDVGRPITDIASILLYDEFRQDLEAVIEKLDRKNRKIRTRDGNWFEVRIVPYRTSDYHIAGAVLTFTDFTRLKEAELEAREGRALAESILETLREPFLVLDEELQVVQGNGTFYRLFGVTPKATEGVPLFELGSRQWDIPDLSRLLKEVVPENTEVRDYRVEGEFPNLGRRAMLLNASRVDRGAERSKLILLTFYDAGGES